MGSTSAWQRRRRSAWSKGNKACERVSLISSFGHYRCEKEAGQSLGDSEWWLSIMPWPRRGQVGDDTVARWKNLGGVSVQVQEDAFVGHPAPDLRQRSARPWSTVTRCKLEDIYELFQIFFLWKSSASTSGQAGGG